MFFLSIIDVDIVFGNLNPFKLIIMIPSEFKYVCHFRIDMLEFDLYKSEDDSYMTECLDTETHQRTELLYPNFDILSSGFSDEFSEAELKQYLLL